MTPRQRPERSFFLPSFLLRNKAPAGSSEMLEDITSPKLTLGIIVALFLMLFDPSSHRETSATRTTHSALQSSCWTGTSSSISVRKSGGIFANPLTAPQTRKHYWYLQLKLKSKRSNPPPNISITFDRKPILVRRRLQEPLTGSSLPH